MNDKDNSVNEIPINKKLYDDAIKAEKDLFPN